MQSDYQKVCEFNKAFDFPQYDDFTDKSCLKLRLDLIAEEITELQMAYEIKDKIEEQDACADILYVAYGMAYTYKINSDEFLDYLICDKNKTLFENIKNNQCNIKSRIDLLELILGQFKKLRKCCELNNNEWVNALHNIIIYVYDFQVASHYDSDRVFTIVHESNMSKLCKSEEEAKLTVEKYNSDYNAGKSPYDTPYYYPLDNGMYVVKNKSTGKALKSINYIKVKL
jgi:predicted HAD superfamily Cof-like phosphohydrolase